MWFPAPLKERWCLHHLLCLFFASLVWNSSMASWSCSILDSFIQDASIGWYPFHLTKYSCFRRLNCLDLSTASISNFASLWTKFGGGFELCYWLGLEASRATDFKRETWNVGWTLRFSSNYNLYVSKKIIPTFWMGPHMGPRTCDSNLLGIENSWCSITLHPLLEILPLIGICS